MCSNQIVHDMLLTPKKYLKCLFYTKTSSLEFGGKMHCTYFAFSRKSVQSVHFTTRLCMTCILCQNMHFYTKYKSKPSILYLKYGLWAFGRKFVYFANKILHMTNMHCFYKIYVRDVHVYYTFSVHVIHLAQIMCKV